MTLGELAIAFSDVVIDGVVVECSRGEDQATAGSLQSICWGSQASLLSLHPRSLSAAAIFAAGWLILTSGIQWACASGLQVSKFWKGLPSCMIPLQCVCQGCQTYVLQQRDHLP